MRMNPSDFRTKTLQCTPSTPEPAFANAEGVNSGQPLHRGSFTLPYDKLVIAVGAYSQSEDTILKLDDLLSGTI